MNVRERVEVENKKNSDLFSSHPCYPVNPQCLPRKILVKKGEEKKKKKKEKKRERKKKIWIQHKPN